jgi:hypothetical protein
MSEIHNRTGQVVYLDVYGGVADDLPVATLALPNGTSRALIVTQDTPPTGVDDRYKVSLTMADTKDDGPLTVTWDFSVDNVFVDKVDEFEVITPYLTIGEVKKIYPEATDDEAIGVEAAVRHIINSHTGQDFGHSFETITVEGHGESALRLPKRLISITGLSTLTSQLDPRATIITSDGWFLKKAWAAETGIISSDSQYWGDYVGGPFDNNIYSDPDGDGEPPIVGPLGSRPGGVIRVPGTSGSATSWSNDYPFRITGEWGYKSVPAPVKEAAKLLVNDYACQEIAFRDRYLESIKAADWRLQFSTQAWERTGNVRADQLLSDYVLMDWAVI